MIQSSDLVRVRVDGLFDLFDHDIVFEHDWDFVILHGINGVGKTKVLDLVKSALTENHGRLLRLPFRSAELTFKDGQRLEISRTADPQDPEGGSDARLRMLLHGVGQKRPVPFDVSAEDFSFHPRIRDELERFTPLASIDEDRFHDTSTGETISTLEALRRYEGAVPSRLREAFGVSIEVPKQFRDFWDAANVHLIETQRLLQAGDLSPRKRPGDRAARQVPTVLGSPRISCIGSELPSEILVASRKNSTEHSPSDS